MASAWELYKAQEAIVADGRAARRDVTLFHGRGGSVGRGGGPTAARDSVAAARIDRRHAARDGAGRDDPGAGSGCPASRCARSRSTRPRRSTRCWPSRARWRALAGAWTAGGIGGTGFRSVVHDDPRFLRYFQAATPEAELDGLHIGSRPARREPGGARRAARDSVAVRVDPDAAAPRVVARRRALDPPNPRITTRARPAAPCTASGRSSARLIDLLQMALAKADPAIAAHYDATGPDRPAGLCARVAGPPGAGHERRARDHGAGHLLADNPVLRRSIDVRNPYVDPINLVQVELLRRLALLRDANAEETVWLRRALLVTINGVAAGMRNTGNSSRRHGLGGPFLRLLDRERDPHNQTDGFGRRPADRRRARCCQAPR